MCNVQLTIFFFVMERSEKSVRRALEMDASKEWPKGVVLLLMLKHAKFIVACVVYGKH